MNNALFIHIPATAGFFIHVKIFVKTGWWKCTLRLKM